jgi:hypothetical protein
MVVVIWTHIHTLHGQSAMPWRIISRWTEYKTAPPVVPPLFAFVSVATQAWTGPFEHHITTDGQSACPPLNIAPIWGPRPDFHHCQIVAGTTMQGLPLTSGQVYIPQPLPARLVITFVFDQNEHSRLLKKLLYVYSTEVNRLLNVNYGLPHNIVLDVNWLKIILTSFFVVTRFASVSLVKQKYFFKCFPHAEVFWILSHVRVLLDGVSDWISDLWPFKCRHHKQPLQSYWITHSKYHCNHSSHKVVSVFSRCFLVTDINTVTITVSLNQIFQISL